MCDGQDVCREEVKFAGAPSCGACRADGHDDREVTGMLKLLDGIRNVIRVPVFNECLEPVLEGQSEVHSAGHVNDAIEALIFRHLPDDLS